MTGKHTQGPVKRDGAWVVSLKGDKICVCYKLPHHRDSMNYPVFKDSPIRANAELIAEAFNVATETGMTPRQLVKRLEEVTLLHKLAEDAVGRLLTVETQRAELLARATDQHTVLEEVEKKLSGHPDFNAWDLGASPVLTLVRAAIAKAKGMP